MDVSLRDGLLRMVAIARRLSIFQASVTYAMFVDPQVFLTRRVGREVT